MAKKSKPLSPREADTLNRLILMENRQEEAEAKAMSWADDHLAGHKRSWNAFRVFITGGDRDDTFDSVCCPEDEWQWYEQKWGWVRKNAIRIHSYETNHKGDLKNVTASFMTGWY